LQKINSELDEKINIPDRGKDETIENFYGRIWIKSKNIIEELKKIDP